MGCRCQLQVAQHLALGQRRHQEIPQHVSHGPPGSLDLGSVRAEIMYDNVSYGFKLYPRLVHTIKAFKSRVQGDIPKTLRGIKTKIAAALEVIRFLSTVNPSEMGGFRIDVTVVHLH